MSGVIKPDYHIRIARRICLHVNPTGLDRGNQFNQIVSLTGVIGRPVRRPFSISSSN